MLANGIWRSSNVLAGCAVPAFAAPRLAVDPALAAAERRLGTSPLSDRRGLSLVAARCWTVPGTELSLSGAFILPVRWPVRLSRPHDGHTLTANSMHGAVRQREWSSILVTELCSNRDILPALRVGLARHMGPAAGRRWPSTMLIARRAEARPYQPTLIRGREFRRLMPADDSDISRQIDALWQALANDDASQRTLTVDEMSALTELIEALGVLLQAIDDLDTDLNST